jgi:hypothetical protein
MAKSIILTEGVDDKAFIGALLKNTAVDFEEVEVSNEMGGLTLPNLKNALSVVKNRTIKKGYQKIGIIIDRDSDSLQQRLNFINQALEGVFNVKLENADAPVHFRFQHLAMEISCHFINLNGVPELEGYLMQIPQSPTAYADCLQQWRNCIGVDKISDKEFRKLWVHYYVRFDTSTAEERQQGGRKCTTEYSLNNKPEHWNFNHPSLENLTNYLRLFV